MKYGNAEVTVGEINECRKTIQQDGISLQQVMENLTQEEAEILNKLPPAAQEIAFKVLGLK